MRWLHTDTVILIHCMDIGMSRLLTSAAAVVLALHGVVHLLGTAVYLELTEVAEFPYKTTLLGGSVDVGVAGMQVFGLFWALAALGFVAAAGALLADWAHWRLLLVGVAALSLV